MKSFVHHNHTPEKPAVADATEALPPIAPPYADSDYNETEKTEVTKPTHPKPTKPKETLRDREKDNFIVDL